MEKSLLYLFLFLAMGYLQIISSENMDHIIGGSLGWTVPPNVTFYQEWAKPRTFGLGDKIVFMYRPGLHNIIQVDKKEFDACTQNKPINMDYNGPTVKKLTQLGEFYYYDGIGTHCEAGQKLAITVTKGPGSSGMFDKSIKGKVQRKLSTNDSASSAAATTISIPKFVVGGGLLSMLVSWLLI